MLFHIRKPQKTGQISFVSREETCPSHQLCPSQRALIAAWRHWGVGVILVWGHYPKGQGVVPFLLPLALQNDLAVLWGISFSRGTGPFLVKFVSVTPRRAMASCSLSAMAAVPPQTQTGHALSWTAGHLSCSTETWGQMIYMPRLQRVFQVATHAPPSTLPWPHTTHPVVMAI